MRRKAEYGIEIATCDGNGEWQVTAAKTGLFTRKPKATARSILERWIFEQAGQLRGGRVLIVGSGGALPKRFEATVRVRVLDASGDRRELAAAYIGSDAQIDRWEPAPGGFGAPVSAGVGRD